MVVDAIGHCFSWCLLQVSGSHRRSDSTAVAQRAGRLPRDGTRVQSHDGDALVAVDVAGLARSRALHRAAQSLRRRRLSAAPQRSRRQIETVFTLF